MSGRSRRAAGALVAAALAALASGCGSAPPGPPPGSGSTGSGPPELVYAALGASETVGVGLADQDLRLRDSWPQLFYNEALPRSATLYNFGIPGSTTRQAIAEQLPPALAVHPSVVTLWLNVNDIIAGVGVGEYEANLSRLVRQLRQGGRATVLVATTPVLDHLPAYLACLPGSKVQASCLLGRGASLPAPDELSSIVDAYNAAAHSVAAAEGATLVDLHAQGDVATLHPEEIAADGFHPSVLGHSAVARLFLEVYRKAHPCGSSRCPNFINGKSSST